MGKVSSHGAPNTKRFAPAKTDEERENQLISLAYDLVEQRLRDGTATSQETVHFLKLGSSREKLDREKIQLEMELDEAKKQSLQSASRIESLYADAVNAFASYQGVDSQNENVETIDDQDLH